MICKFCGQNNSDDAAFCSRCGSPLRENHQARPAAPDVSGLDDDKKTMRMQSRPDEAGAGGVRVHDCGYPLLPGVQVCPKCHKPVAGAATPTPPAPPTPISDAKKTVVIGSPAPPVQGNAPKATEQFVTPDQGGYNPKKTERFVAPGSEGTVEMPLNPSQGSSAKKTERFPAPDQQVAAPKSTVPSIDPRLPSAPPSAKKTERFVPSGYEGGPVNKRTVNIHQVQKPVVREPEPEPEVVPHCSLKPLAREGETAAVPAKRDFDADKVVLNRDNTDPGNYSITSQQQALLTFENGKWYIEDRSAYKTTYIRVTKRTELHEGDIVGLGDREFEFTTK